ncbi:MAG: hypothetical protein GDA36_06515 [Rhodobacteraceae bacterium]|nr:hypothetical protein [Paracoccaceae bacterium]
MRTNHQPGRLPGGVQGWFDGPVFARFVSNAVRIGADDVLTGINTLMDWRSCSPTRKRGLGHPGIGPRGYDLIAIFATHWCRAVSTMTFWPGGAIRGLRAAAEKGRSGNHWCHTGAKCHPPRQPYQRAARPDRSGGLDNPPDGPLDDPAVHVSADTQARWIRNGAKRMLGYEDDIQAALPGRTRPEPGKFHRQGPHDTYEPG